MDGSQEGFDLDEPLRIHDFREWTQDRPTELKGNRGQCVAGGVEATYSVSGSDTSRSNDLLHQLVHASEFEVGCRLVPQESTGPGSQERPVLGEHREGGAGFVGSAALEHVLKKALVQAGERFVKDRLL